MITFIILAAVIVVGALGVVLLRQPVHAALSLVGTLLALATMYVTLEAHFLGIIQVIVYAGAIMVLFLFVIMLLNIADDDARPSLDWLTPAALIAGVMIVLALALSILGTQSNLPSADAVAEGLQRGGAGAIAEPLFTDFLLAFHLVGLLLLTGTIAAVSLVQRRAIIAETSATISESTSDPTSSPTAS